MHKVNSILVLRTDGSGERLLTENYYQEALGLLTVVFWYSMRNQGYKGEDSSKLWSIDITGYNERRLLTKTDASDPSWSSLLSK